MLCKYCAQKLNSDEDLRVGYHMGTFKCVKLHKKIPEPKHFFTTLDRTRNKAEGEPFK